MSRIRYIRWGLTAVVPKLAACGPTGQAGSQHDAATSTSTQASSPAADQPLQLVIEGHRFTPSEITVPANQAVEIEVVNKDPQVE